MNLEKINSMTKYPSILTYHAMGERGKLLDEVKVPFDSEVIVTEKIDGVNARLVVFPNGDYFIGSREELLYAKGDRIGNPQLGIVEALKGIADRFLPTTYLTVFYFEVYGGNVTKSSKQYTGNKTVGYRLFDIAILPPDYEAILEWPGEKIAAWRDNGGQLFYPEAGLCQIALQNELRLTPRICNTNLPAGIDETYKWLKSVISATHVGLDDGALGRPEGVVVRTSDRSRIAKLRFEDYERTMRSR